MGLTQEDSIMVGDSDLDIAAGKSAGVRTVGVTYGYRDRAFLTDADYVIDEIKDLPLIIQGLC